MTTRKPAAVATKGWLGREFRTAKVYMRNVLALNGGERDLLAEIAALKRQIRTMRRKP